MTNRHKAYLALLLNAAIWGLALPLAKKGFEQTEPMTFLFYRYLFAVIFGLPIFLLVNKKNLFKLKNSWEVLGLAVFSNLLAHWLLYFGLNKTTALEASLLTMLTPIFVAIGGVAFLKEKISKQEKLGTTLAFLGSFFIVAEPLVFNNQQLSFSHFLGNFSLLGYCFSWTLAALWLKKVARKYHPFALFYLIFVINAIGFLPLAIWQNPLLFSQNYFTLPSAFTASFYMGTLGSLGAFYLYQYGQKYIEASEAVLFTYLTSLFSAPIAILWLKEKLTLPFLVGAIIIIVGIFIAETRKRLIR